MSTLKPEIVEHLEGIEPWTDARTAVAGSNGNLPDDDVLVFTIHDGDRFPRHLFGERCEEVLGREEIRATYVRERDWGANLVARELARELGLGGYLRVRLARMVMDFGRFPGSSGPGEQYLLRHAIFPPLQGLLSEEARHEILTRYYDDISQVLTQHFAMARVTLSIHTYDPRNHSGTERPEVSLVTRALEYQRRSTLPPYIFDPLFPPVLSEATCNRLLTYRAALDLEHGGRRTALNYPYVMPEGSVEMRAQVWFFFRHLRRRFTESRPETHEQPAYQRVWQMLLDVTRRSGDCERLRAYLHRYREAPPGMEKLYAEARRAYGEIGGFLTQHGGDLVDAWRFSAERPSCLGIEVRKDLLCEIDRERSRVAPRPDAERVARDIARLLAPAVRDYVGGSAIPPRSAEAPIGEMELLSGIAGDGTSAQG